MFREFRLLFFVLVLVLVLSIAVLSTSILLSKHLSGDATLH